jgi:hypothetical protein
MTVTVINMRWGNKPDFRCDRASPLGNPFKMRDQSEAERHRVCVLYDSYFHQNLNPDVAPPGFLEALDEILTANCERDITLGCWCAPKRCHCETIKKYVDSQEAGYC